MRVVFIISSILVLIGLMAYLRLSFQEADVKTALRLIDEAKPRGVPLATVIQKVLPLDRRLCEASVINQFHGHMEVTCQDVKMQSHVLRWKVDVIGGAVQPANEAATRLGNGEEPW